MAVNRFRVDPGRSPGRCCRRRSCTRKEGGTRNAPDEAVFEAIIYLLIERVCVTGSAVAFRDLKSPPRITGAVLETA
ncbi:hypothetical protein GCM10010156_57220 [Planobispora rosea]|uniref:Uncharacterized protein n=1 Tax=Planobispora rosea TaxID=35762 RepID=A0A8J3S6I3_PLARO|nr:hypothetical protein GCM10010156_57220 [Planobispora rosea]GIH87025.1 hypothetical protein Pro02_54330 [Planobispora rosea]